MNIIPKLRLAFPAIGVIWVTAAGLLLTVKRYNPYSTTLLATSGHPPVTYAFQPSNPTPQLLNLNGTTGVLNGFGYDDLQPTWVTASGLLATFRELQSITPIVLSATPNGGRTVTQYDVVSGSLPPGLKIDNSNGTISGTTGDVQGPFNPPPTVPVWTTPAGVIATVFEKTAMTPVAVLATGTGVTYNIIGSIPVGIKIDSSTGTFSGSPIAPPSAFEPNTDVPVWTTAAGSRGSVARGAVFSSTIVATNGGGVDYCILSGDLPAGVYLNKDTGVLSGTVATSGSGLAPTGVYNFTVRAFVTGSIYKFADRAFSITVT